MASSIPQFNIVELNNALIYLLDHPDCSFEEIYCAPDFATGAILYNEDEVKESMKNGTGAACKLRSVVDFDAKERCFVVTEIPYSVYTNTICEELEEITNGDDNPGIERFNDLTGEQPLIKIYLSKKANPDKVLKYLYKNTSLQYYYGINFTMLDNGRFPRVFTWKEMLQAHLDHERAVYRRGFEYDLHKIQQRIHIINGLMICTANIEEVVQTIKQATSTNEASLALQSKFVLDVEQAKAVLDMKLSRLAHLEVKKLEDERTKLMAEEERITKILESEILMNEEIKSGLREVAKNYGDARRTKIMNLCTDDTDAPVEVKMLQVSLTNQNNLFVSETSTLYSQRRGGVGTKIKTNDGEYIISTINIQSDDTLLLFSKKGNYYHCKASQLLIDKNYIGSLVSFNEEDDICAITSLSKNNENPYIIFVTKNGIIKKSNISEYNITRNICCKAIALDDTDEIKSVIFTKNDKLGILTFNGNFVIINTEDLRDTSRISRGVIGIKLNENDFVVSSKIISNEKRFITISANGLAKQTNSNEFTVQGRNTKGTKIQKLTDGDSMVDFCPIMDEKQISIISNHSIIKIDINEIPLYTKGAQGVKSIKLSNNDKIVKIVAN